MESRSRLLIVLLGAASIIIGLITVVAPHVRASGMSWTQELPKVIGGYEMQDTERLFDDCRQPHYQYVDSVTVQGITRPYPIGACIASGSSGIKFGVYNNSTTVVSFPGDQKMYTVDYQCTLAHPYCLYIPSSDTLVARERVGSSYYGTKLVVYKNVKQRLTRQNDNTYGTIYSFNTTNPDFVLSSSDSPSLPVRSIGVSDNGRWLAAEIEGVAIIRIDLDSFEIKKYSDIRTSHWYAGPQYEYAVTDQGDHIAMMGLNAAAEVYEITNGCGTVLSTNSTRQEFYNNITEPCPVFQIYAHPNLPIPSPRHSYNPIFDGEGGELTIYTDSYVTTPKKIVFHAAGYTPSPKLDYLALGDSYSSGEGDTERNADGNKFYRSFTNNEESQGQGTPREKCHLSTRSYPYKLALGMGLGDPGSGSYSGKWQSVACSGAKVADVLRSNNYKGQNKGGGSEQPRLDGYADYQSLQTTALNEFIPGRVEQIKFVEKYKPKTMTLTMGGNDAGFGDVMQACVNPLTEWTSTCSYAKDDDKKSQLGNWIKEKYTSLRSLYVKLIEKSNGGKLYILGYPQFVAYGPSNAQCGLNVRLNNDERKMARESLSYMNSVIKAAAQAAGAIYINTEHALSGHQLCDSDDKAVTGITLLGGDRQESFHPNSKGHALLTNVITQAMGSASLLTYNCADAALVTCPNPQTSEPPIPAYFATAIENNIRSRNEPLTVGKIVKGVFDTVVQTGDYIFGKDSIVNITLYSEPHDLGIFTTNSQGALAATVQIPTTITPGYHTLEVTGITYSGEPIKLWQIIEVHGPDPSDIDENGIPDTQQPCGPFLTPSGIDADQDGIDDACDPEIGEPPVEPTPTPTPTPTPSPDPSPTPEPPAPSNPVTSLINTIVTAVQNIVTTIINIVVGIVQKLRFRLW